MYAYTVSIKFVHDGYNCIKNFRSVSPTFRAYYPSSGYVINFPIIAPTWNITNAITNVDLSLSLGSVAIVVIIAIF